MTEPRDTKSLTGKQKSFLRALAHPLKPVVQIGHNGLTDGVVSQIDGALQTHELIKIKLTGEDEEASAKELAPEIAQRTRSTVAQVIGKTMVLYRARKKDPTIVLPKATEKAAKKA